MPDLGFGELVITVLILVFIFAPSALIAYGIYAAVKARSRSSANREEIVELRRRLEEAEHQLEKQGDSAPNSR